MDVEKQKQALMTAGVYYALDICWEPSCYSRNPGKSWWVPREWFKRVSPLAAAVPDSEAIPCSTLWDEARYSRTADPWRKFFITTADFEEYNHTRMAAADPQAHRWCSTKLLFDFTPYVTRSDWMHELRDQRQKWNEYNRRCRRKRKPSSEIYHKTKEIWRHFTADELSQMGPGLGDDNGEELAPEQIAAARPYAAFLDSDWARNGIQAKLRGMPRSRREKQYSRVAEMVGCWPVPPNEVLWVGGTYARHPDYFPPEQQERAWVYAKLRPLGIQPSKFLSTLHQAGRNEFAPTELWRRPRTPLVGADEEGADVLESATSFPGVLPSKVRAGKLWTHLDTHGLHKSLWYGHALRNEHKHHTAVLAHPVPDEWSQLFGFIKQRPLHLPAAPRLEDMP